MSEEAAYVVKEMLTEAVKTGTSTTCTVEGMSVAAKQEQQTMIMIDGFVHLLHIIHRQFGMDMTIVAQ